MLSNYSVLFSNFPSQAGICWMIISKMVKALKLGGDMTSGHFNQKFKGQPLQCDHPIHEVWFKNVRYWLDNTVLHSPNIWTARLWNTYQYKFLQDRLILYIFQSQFNKTLDFDIYIMLHFSSHSDTLRSLNGIKWICTDFGSMAKSFTSFVDFQEAMI